MAARRPAAIMDDIIVDIFLRLPPDDTACLTRASLVCKAWRRLLSNPGFLRRYREVHGAAPVLGFLYNNYAIAPSTPLFIPTTPTMSPFPPPALSVGTGRRSPNYCRTLDCRHGRVLLYHPAYPSCFFPDTSRFIVWDPITGKRRRCCVPKYVYPDKKFMAAVLCAASGCDHTGCSGGPFLVVLVVHILRQDCCPWIEPVAKAQASVYSSDTGKWSVSSSIDFDSFFTATTPPSLLAGDTLFFRVRSTRILKYDLTRGVLSVLMPWVPIHYNQSMILCTAEDGGLGVATVDGGNRLRIFSGRANLDGVTEWAEGRVIELDSMISSGVGDHLSKIDVVGFAEGTGYVFIRADDRIFSVEQKSGWINKIGTAGKFGPIFPFMRFYIPDLARARLQLQLPMGLNDQ